MLGVDEVLRGGSMGYYIGRIGLIRFIRLAHKANGAIRLIK